MEKQRYNLKDVAKLAGVSLGTASKVINNQYVRPEARLKVEEAMQELDYTPNAIARSLKANSTKTIGIMIPDISSPVVGKVLRGIEKISRDSGYSILLYNTTRNTRLEEDAIQAFMRSQVDGIIYLGNTVGDEIAEGLKRTHVPVVFAMTQYPDKYFSSVTIDNEEAAYHVPVRQGPQAHLPAGRRGGRPQLRHPQNGRILPGPGGTGDFGRPDPDRLRQIPVGAGL